MEVFVLVEGHSGNTLVLSSFIDDTKRGRRKRERNNQIKEAEEVRVGGTRGRFGWGSRARALPLLT